MHPLARGRGWQRLAPAGAWTGMEGPSGRSRPLGECGVWRSLRSPALREGVGKGELYGRRLAPARWDPPSPSTRQLEFAGLRSGVGRWLQ